jgi:tRNA (guanine37-N1)-methyltransferase
LPFKYAIAQILQDKNSGVRTVVNKIETINESEFRTFPMEVLAGPPDFEVTMVRFGPARYPPSRTGQLSDLHPPSQPESGCEFTFDFSRVYWNSRLSHEHERLIALFKKGDIIADVMAGVGPFVVPAAKRGCFVFANDLNPESTRWLDINRKKNKISEDTLRITTLDGKAFIQRVVGQVGAEPFKPLQISAKSKSKVTGASKVEKQGTSSKSAPKAEAKASPPRGPQPHLPASPYIEHRPSSPYIKHFIMNLPATAITFLGAFRGSYAVLPESERAAVEMPIVHCHYFDKAPLAEDHTDEKAEKALMEVGPWLPACLSAAAARSTSPASPSTDPSLAFRSQLASHYLGHPIDAQNPGFYIHKVRLVAPNKWMYCIGFELPREVAFAEEAA